MKKSSLMLLLLAAVLTAAGASLIFYSSLFNYSSVDLLAEEAEPTFDSGLYAKFLAAKNAEDYVSMNALFNENMAATGVVFPECEDYDSTHGGKIYTYPYKVKIDGDVVSGNLYILAQQVNKEALSTTGSDYIALDSRNKSDPEFVVFDSYRANRQALIEALCDLLLLHEKKHPTRWERTKNSLIDEWTMHNAAYSMNYKIDHSKDVNLNNADENTDWFKRAAEELGE